MGWIAFAALGSCVPMAFVPAAPQTAQPAQPVQPSYTEPGAGEGYGEYSDDGSQGAYDVPQQDTQQPQNVQPPQQSQGAPLQSGTS